MLVPAVDQALSKHLTKVVHFMAAATEAQGAWVTFCGRIHQSMTLGVATVSGYSALDPVARELFSKFHVRGCMGPVSPQGKPFLEGIAVFKPGASPGVPWPVS